MVLMVAAFENYLKEVTDERLQDLISHSKYRWTKLPENLVYHNHFHTLDVSIYGPFKSKKHSDKIIGFDNAAQLIVSKQINSQVFCEVARSNPNSERVNELFVSLGFKNLFPRIKVEFDQKWGSPTLPKFIEENLDSILKRRHEVAHTANVMNISGHDLEEYLRFLNLLAGLCDKALFTHIKDILKI